MRLGTSSFTYTWAAGVPGYPPERPLQWPELLERAAKLGVHVVQICDNMPLTQLCEEDLAVLEQRASALDVRIEVGTRGIGHDHLRTNPALAERPGSSLLRLVTDTATHHPGEGEIVETLRALAPARWPA